MKVFLSADIEGTCGIVDRAETDRGSVADYTPLARQMTLEVKAACEGALAAGASEILIKDAHGTARNLDHGQLPRRRSPVHDERIGQGELWSGILYRLPRLGGLRR